MGSNDVYAPFFNSMTFTLATFHTFSVKEMKYRTWKFVINKCLAWQGTQYDPAFKDFVYEDKGNFSAEFRELLSGGKMLPNWSKQY